MSQNSNNSNPSFGERLRAAFNAARNTPTTQVEQQRHDMADILAPLKAIASRIAPMNQAEKQAPKAPKPEKALNADAFVDKFMGELVDEGDSTVAATRLRQYELFNLAVLLASMHSRESAAVQQRFYVENGIEFDLLPNNSLISNGGLASIVNRLLSGFQRYRGFGEKNLERHMQNHTVDLEDLLKKLYEFEGARNRPGVRKNIADMTKAILADFGQLLENDEDLEDLLNAILQQSALHEKVHDKEVVEQEKKAVMKELERRAPALKPALEKLLALKSLSGNRAARFVLAPENYDLMFSLGIDHNSLLRDFFDHLEDRFDSMPDDTLRRQFDAQDWPNNPSDVLLALVNEPIGKKFCHALGVDFRVFEEALHSSSNHVLGQIDATGHAIEAVSVDDYVERLVQSPYGAGYSDYILALNESSTQLAQHRSGQSGLWQSLARSFRIPVSQAGVKADKVNGIYQGLLSNARYNEVVKQFDRLAAIVLGHVKLDKPNHRNDTDEVKAQYAARVEAIKEVKEAMGDRREGFERDFLYTMPVSNKGSIQISGLRQRSYFSLQVVIEKYIEELPHMALVDIQQEIENDILMPIAVELGLDIEETAAFEANQPDDYISEEDFNMAKKMGLGLHKLNDVSIDMPEPPKKPEESKESADSEKEVDYDVEAIEKAEEQFVAQFRGAVNKIGKAKEKKEGDKGIAKEIKERV